MIFSIYMQIPALCSFPKPTTESLQLYQSIVRNSKSETRVVSYPRNIKIVPCSRVNTFFVLEERLLLVTAFICRVKDFLVMISFSAIHSE